MWRRRHLSAEKEGPFTRAAPSKKYPAEILRYRSPPSSTEAPYISWDCGVKKIFRGNSELLEPARGRPYLQAGLQFSRGRGVKKFLGILLIRPDDYAGIEAVARAHGAGVWGLVFVPPWTWRAKLRAN